jgi:membrane-associated phospholipid phosphatase
MTRLSGWVRSSLRLRSSAGGLLFASLFAAQTARANPASLPTVQQREVPRRVGLPAPEPVQPPPEHVHFIADPLSDGAVLSLTLGTGALSEAILATGEIKPQAPGDPAKLLVFDRAAVDQTPAGTWGTVSAIGLFSAFGFAALDPILSGFRDGTETAIVDAVIYAETVSITWTTTNLAKIAFRRPRPSAYREARRLREAGVPETEIASRITDTNSALSFFSGHGSTTAGVAATASYLAFARAPGTPRPWITLGVGALVTTVTCVGRVRSGEHFPTDVIAGAMAGFGIGILVAHSHRAEAPTQRPIWIGAAPVADGGIVTVSGLL